MDILSSPWISYITLSLGLALFLCPDKTLRLVGAWFFAEFLCDAVATGLDEYVYSAVITAYFYLYAITSLMFSVWVLVRNKAYSKSIISLFVSISVLSVAFAAYRYSMQSRWDLWGREFYSEFGIYPDALFFLSIVALEALMITLGVYSALATNTNTNNGIRGERR